MTHLLANPLTYIILGMIIQHLIAPRLKWRYGIAILPTFIVIFGIYALASYLGLLGYLAIAIIFLLMAYTSRADLRKKSRS
ncbi:hypothetical protein [Limosilactobacillus ingluviei]